MTFGEQGEKMFKEWLQEQQAEIEAAATNQGGVDGSATFTGEATATPPADQKSENCHG